MRVRFFRQLKFQEFDVCELSFSSYVLSLNGEGPPFIAIPVFPSRLFRHQSMYINTNSGIKETKDLKGKRIGTPEYQSKLFSRKIFGVKVSWIDADLVTAAVWQRGIMEEEFGVRITGVEFFSGAIEPSVTERKSKLAHDLPAGVKVTQIQLGQNLSQMLADGELDASFSATKPSTLDVSPDVQYLFPNFKQVEADYYRRTRILPIMHTVAIKRDVYNANPWIAKDLNKAFASSIEIGCQALEDRAALKYMLPWLEDHLRETKRLMGESVYLKDGFHENKHVIDKFLEYHDAQGLSKRKFNAEELFAPSCLEDFVI